MICLRCGHYTHPDREMDREQHSENCACECHPWHVKPTPEEITASLRRLTEAMRERRDRAEERRHYVLWVLRDEQWCIVGQYASHSQAVTILKDYRSRGEKAKLTHGD